MTRRKRTAKPFISLISAAALTAAAFVLPAYADVAAPARALSADTAGSGQESSAQTTDADTSAPGQAVTSYIKVFGRTAPGPGSQTAAVDIAAISHEENTVVSAPGQTSSADISSPGQAAAAEAAAPAQTLQEGIAAAGQTVPAVIMALSREAYADVSGTDQTESEDTVTLDQAAAKALAALDQTTPYDYIPVATEKTDDTSRFGAGRFTLLSNKDSNAQNLAAVFENGEGGLIVVDGGWEDNAGSLLEELKSRGGHVIAWLVTHPDADHAFALKEILNRHAGELEIDGIYYSFHDEELLGKLNSKALAAVKDLKAAFNTLPPEKLHGDISAGQVIEAGPALIQVINNPYAAAGNYVNNSSVVYMVSLNGTNVVFLGDLGLSGGNNLVSRYDLGRLGCDMVQVAHHGQEAAGFNVYKALKPSVFLWPTPKWLWDNDSGNGAGSGQWATQTTRNWMTALGVSEYYVTKDGDQVIE